MNTFARTAACFAAIAFMPSLLFGAVATFSHPDINQYSPRFNQNVGPYDAFNTNTVTMWYHQYNRY